MAFPKTTLVLLLLIGFSAQGFSQGSPEKFSRDFLNCFINYNEEKLKAFIPSDPAEQTAMLAKLKEIYTTQVKPVKTATLSSSVRAVLKDGNEKYKQLSDIIITISPDGKTKYELTLWGCYVKEGKWMLGEKVDWKKL
jgi:hypothetical protein